MLARACQWRSVPQEERDQLLRRSARGANSPLPAARSAMDRTSQMPFAWSSLLGPDPWAGLSWRRHFTLNHPLSERLAQQGSPFLPVYLGLTVPPRSTGWDRGALSSDRLREPLEMSQFRTPGVMFKQCALESPVPALTWNDWIKLNRRVWLHVRLHVLSSS